MSKTTKLTLNDLYEQILEDKAAKRVRENIQKGFDKAFSQIFDNTPAAKKAEKVIIRKPNELEKEFEKFFSTHPAPKGVEKPVNLEKSSDEIELDELLEQLTSDVAALEEEELPPKQTLVVNLFAGPGTGKSTCCAGIFFDLKNLHIDCEIANEYAKELVWEKRTNTFNNQIYLFAKQHHKIFRLLGQVDVVITDCPILLSPVYDGENRKTLEKLAVDEHNKMWTYNVFLKRKKIYNPNGRIHTEEQAHNIDRKVADVLTRNNIPFEVFEADPKGKSLIVLKILTLLRWQQNKVQREKLNARRSKKIR